jgi:hypothetical protein
MYEANKGIAVRIDRVIMKKGTYKMSWEFERKLLNISDIQFM